MIISNEPGYYKTGEYGIRIENLVLVVDREIEGAEKEMLGFETLTFAPIDRRLIDAEMLEPEELVWLNHAGERRDRERSHAGKHEGFHGFSRSAGLIQQVSPWAGVGFCSGRCAPSPAPARAL